MRCGVIVGNGELEEPRRVVFEDMPEGNRRVVGACVRDPAVAIMHLKFSA